MQDLSQGLEEELLLFIRTQLWSKPKLTKVIYVACFIYYSLSPQQPSCEAAIIHRQTEELKTISLYSRHLAANSGETVLSGQEP